MPVSLRPAVRRVMTILVGGALAWTSCQRPTAQTTSAELRVDYTVRLERPGSACGAAILGSRLLVCHPASGSVVLYDSVGTNIRVVAPPAGFGPVAGIVAVARDTALMIPDTGAHAALVVGAEARVLRGRPMAGLRIGPKLLRSPLADGSWLVAAMEPVGGLKVMRRLENQKMAASLIVQRVGPGTGVDTLLTLPLRSQYVVSAGNRSAIFTHPLRPRTLISAGSKYLAWASSGEPQVRIAPLGEPSRSRTRVVEVGLSPDLEAEAVWQGFIRGHREGTPALRARLRENEPSAEPQFLSELHIGVDGYLWVAEWVPPSARIRRWHVFAAATEDTGILLELPPDWRVATAAFPRVVLHDSTEGVLRVGTCVAPVAGVPLDHRP